MSTKFFLIFFLLIFRSKCQFNFPFFNFGKRANQNQAFQRNRQTPRKSFPLNIRINQPQRYNPQTINIKENGRFQRTIEPLIGKIQFQGLFQQFKSGLNFNDFLINIVEILRYQNTHFFQDNYARNTLAFKNHISTIKDDNGYIENQNEYIDMIYGKKRLKYNGCGVIAIYNVIYHLTKKENIDFPAIIKALEYDGIILNGLFGTSMKAIDDYFKSQGFKTKSSSKMADYYDISQYYDAFVLTVINNKRDITQGLHFMAITKDNNKYTVHNGYTSTPVTYNSMNDVITNINFGKAKDVYLTGVKKY